MNRAAIGSKGTPAVAVIGAGIVGASVAYHLARRGASVTLIDKGQPAADCTANSFAWIGVGGMSAFRARALEEYYRLERELRGRLRINWTGALVWSHDPAATEERIRQRVAAGLIACPWVVMKSRASNPT